MEYEYPHCWTSSCRCRRYRSLHRYNDYSHGHDKRKGETGVFGRYVSITLIYLARHPGPLQTYTLLQWAFLEHWTYTWATNWWCPGENSLEVGILYQPDRMRGFRTGLHIPPSKYSPTTRHATSSSTSKIGYIGCDPEHYRNRFTIHGSELWWHAVLVEFCYDNRHLHHCWSLACSVRFPTRLMSLHESARPSLSGQNAVRARIVPDFCNQCIK